MSVLKLIIILDFYTSGNSDVTKTDIHREAAAELEYDGMIELNGSGVYEATEMLRFYVGHILSVPMPVVAYKIGE